MTTAGKVFVGVGAVSVALVLLLWLEPEVERRLAPVPQAAWVAVEVGGSGVAELGPVEIDAATEFRLHAVLEARDRAGERVFYTDAEQLRFEGELVDVEAVRSWDQRLDVKVLWFTIEGRSPYIQMEPGQNLERMRFEEFFRPGWSTSWTVAGVLDSRFDDQIETEGPERLAFGTQRYRVWIEIYDPASPLVPKDRFKSPGADELLDGSATVAVVTAILPAAPEASAVFGLSQIEPPPEAPDDLLVGLARLSEQRLAFTRVLLLRDLIAPSGLPLEELPWQRADLLQGPAWGTDIESGALIQVGARFVVLYRDRGREGVLDVDDLCFDFEQGAAIRRLGDVFTGEGEVEWVQIRR